MSRRRLAIGVDEFHRNRWTIWIGIGGRIQPEWVDDLNRNGWTTSPEILSQPELRSKLRLRAFEAISQRVTLRFHLTGLPEPETKAYIGHHLKVAGVAHPLFSDEAVHLIHQFTKGIPRRINNVATACLLAGYVEQKTLIDEATARKALAEFQDDLGG
ncbi:MAG: hypothetical protein AB1700_03800 [Bacillota bacterium]